MIQFYSQLESAFPEVDSHLCEPTRLEHSHPSRSADGLGALLPLDANVADDLLTPGSIPLRSCGAGCAKMFSRCLIWVEDWSQVKQRVNDFLDQFAYGSVALLSYVGLVGKGKLVKVINYS